MVHFNELKITQDSRNLIIDVSVRNESYYDNVYIDSILIDDQDTYVGSGPSSTPVYTYSVPEDTQLKNIRLVLDRFNLESLDKLFFVYVSVKGTPSPDTPCGMDNVTTMRTVCNIYPYYQQAMNYIGDIANTCTVPQNFIDFILRLKALDLSVKTGNYPDAIKYYNKFFSNRDGSSIKIGGCGCGNH